MSQKPTGPFRGYGGEAYTEADAEALLAAIAQGARVTSAVEGSDLKSTSGPQPHPNDFGIGPKHPFANKK